MAHPRFIDRAADRYAMRARIELDGRLWFTNTRHIPAFPDGGGPIQVLVDQVGGEKQDFGW